VHAGWPSVLLADFFILKAYKQGVQISVGGPIIIGGSIVVVTMMGLFLGEKMTLLKAVSILMIASGASILGAFRAEDKRIEENLRLKSNQGGPCHSLFIGFKPLAHADNLIGLESDSPVELDHSALLARIWTLIFGNPSPATAIRLPPPFSGRVPAAELRRNRQVVEPAPVTLVAGHNVPPARRRRTRPGTTRVEPEAFVDIPIRVIPGNNQVAVLPQLNDRCAVNRLKEPDLDLHGRNVPSRVSLTTSNVRPKYSQISRLPETKDPSRLCAALGVCRKRRALIQNQHRTALIIRPDQRNDILAGLGKSIRCTFSLCSTSGAYFRNPSTAAQSGRKRAAFVVVKTRFQQKQRRFRMSHLL